MTQKSNIVAYLLQEYYADQWSGAPEIIGVAFDYSIALEWAKEAPHYMITRSIVGVPVYE